MEETWLDWLEAGCSCISPFSGSSTAERWQEKETAFCDEQYQSSSLWSPTLWLYILPHCVVESPVFPSMLGARPTTPGWCAEQTISDFSVHSTTSVLARTVCSKANPLTPRWVAWQRTQTFQYAWAPHLFLSWPRRAIICRPMTIHCCYMGQILHSS